MKSVRGFGAIAIVVAIAALLLIGGTTWVILAKGTPKAEPKPAATETLDATEDLGTPPEAPDGWTKYTSKVGLYTLYYPGEWKTADNPDLCSEGTLLLGVEYDHAQNTVGKCASGFGGQIVFSSVEGDVRAQYPTSGVQYSGPLTSAVKVNGVEGTKFIATYSGASEDEAGSVAAAGTKLVRYIFSSGGRTFVAQYTQEPDWPDVQADFDKAVTSYWKFPVTETTD